MSKQFYLNNELDSEAIKLLDENDSIVEKNIEECRSSNLTGEALRTRQDEVYDKFMNKCDEVRAKMGVSVVSESDKTVNESLTALAEAQEELSVEPVVAQAAPSSLKEVRKSMKMTQVEFAKALELSQALISQVEKGKVPMSKTLQAKVDDLWSKQAA
jgi:DNA-binding XRE family transcriptional regulator